MKTLVMILFLVGATTAAESLQDQLNEKKQSSKAPEAIKSAFEKGIQDLRDSGILKKTLKKGKKIPDFSLMDERGVIIPIKKLYSKKPVVLTFYRGGWCPYCLLELKAYEALKSEFDEAGAIIIALVPDEWKEIRKTKGKYNLSFDIFRDKNNNIAKRIGLAFKVDAETLKYYKKFGIDLKKYQGNDNNELPMPGTYVIDTKGVIRFAFADPDYKKRAEPGKVLDVVKSIR